MREWVATTLLIVIFSSLILGAASGCGIVGGGWRRPSIDPNLPVAKPVIKIVEKMNWAMPLLLVGGVGGGVFSFILGSHRIGIKVFAGTLPTVSIVVGVMQFMWQLAVVGFIAGIVLLGYTIYINRKAMVLTIKGVDDYVQKHPEQKAELTGTLADAHGKDVNVLSIIKTGKMKIRKKAKKLAAKAERAAKTITGG